MHHCIAQAQQFRVARFTCLKLELVPLLPSGFIRIEFTERRWNVIFQRMDNVYACFETEDESSFLGFYFETALTDFCI